MNLPVLLAGPTAVGKSEIAMLLAEKIGGEIISVDSMQVYRGLDIGTAKPSTDDRARVPHHLTDVVDLTEEFDAAKFAAMARKTVKEIQLRGHVPVLCGGTGLYFRAFLEGLGAAPPTDRALRTALDATPLADMLRELAERDPKTFETIDRKNPRRVIRAIEVIRVTGKPFSEQRANWQPSTLDPRPSTPLFGLSRAPEHLRRRINERVELMFRRGLVDETRELLNHGLSENKTAMQALGYRQVVEHLRGERSLEETIELVKIRTRQFAKRQMTWFKKQPGVNWIYIKADERAEPVVENLIAASEKCVSLASKGW
jgi:tRNA dimethylallyltransferase